MNLIDYDFPNYAYTYVVKDFVPRGYICDESKINDEKLITVSYGDHSEKIPIDRLNNCTFIEPEEILDHTFNFRRTIAAVCLAESLHLIEGAFLETKDYKWMINFTKKDVEKFTFGELVQAINLIKSIAWDDGILSALIDHENILGFSRLKSKKSLISFINKQYEKGLWTELDSLRSVDFVIKKRKEYLEMGENK